jgi:hypothetical protein
LAFFIGWFDAVSIQDKTILVFKLFSSIMLLNAVLLGYHFSELKNIKYIINEIVKDYRLSK